MTSWATIDYRTIGVPEIIFIDLPQQRIRVLRKRDQEYEENTLTEGALRLESLDGLQLECAWLLAEPRPLVFDLLTQLLREAR